VMLSCVILSYHCDAVISRVNRVSISSGFHSSMDIHLYWYNGCFRSSKRDFLWYSYPNLHCITWRPDC